LGVERGIYGADSIRTLCIRTGDLRREGVRCGGRSAPVGVSVLDLHERPELVALFVDPDLIGTGVGRALLQNALERTRHAGLDSVLIESDPNAERFYRSQGAVPAGHRTSATTGRELALLRLSVVAPIEAPVRARLAHSVVVARSQHRAPESAALTSLRTHPTLQRDPMPRHLINSERLHRDVPYPYAAAATCEAFVFAAGAGPLDGDGLVVASGDIPHERRRSRVLLNIGSRRDQHSAAGSRVGDGAAADDRSRLPAVGFPAADGCLCVGAGGLVGGWRTARTRCLTAHSPVARA
jgi:Acetyltransferase (GNAT) domain